MAEFKNIPREKHEGGVPESGSLPGIHFHDKQFPEIKNWEVGETREITFKIKMTSFREDENETSAGFDVVAVKDSGGKKFDSKVMRQFRQGKLKKGTRTIRSLEEATEMAKK